MTRMVDLTLTVNGEQHILRVEPFETLLTTLRDRLRLTAAKRGCNQGICAPALCWSEASRRVPA